MSTEYYDSAYRAGEEIPRSSKTLAVRLIGSAPPVLDVLDVGCGTGLNAMQIRALGHVPFGIDVSEVAIAKYRDRGFQAMVGDVQRGLALPGGRFDLVFMAEVLEHLTDPDRALQEVRRLLRPHGRVILTTPNSAFWPYRLAALAGLTVSEIQHPHHYRFFSVRSLARLVRASGFRIVQLLGRNMYLIVPDPGFDLGRTILRACRLQEELHFTLGRRFWHLSRPAQRGVGLMADTLLMVARRDGVEA